uniref:5'-3' DNA helicase ZGRF1 n=1 Tax=Anas platyrhynchos TaxID=8839 RepID=A0A8B9TRV9_ANAPL
MSAQEFTVLYTHQKMKKSKTWQDGTLRMRPGGNKVKNSALMLCHSVNAGDNLESERYLITVEAVKVNEKPCEDQPRKAEIIEVNRNGVKPGILPSRHLSVGLKRKFTGFQGPRQVEKKTPTMEDEENPATSFTSKQCQGIFPSKFCITSPLFSTIGEKNAETKLSTDFHDDELTNNNRDHGSFSLVSPQFLDTCNEIEKRSSHQSIVKPESPLITGHTKSYNQTTGRGAVSQNIRSTAQIIALLKSKTTQACREEATPEVTKRLSRFQVPENTNSLCNPKSTTLPAFSGNSDKRLAQNIQNMNSTKETKVTFSHSKAQKECTRALGVSEDITLTESGIVKEEFSTHDKDCGQDEQIMQVNFNLLEAFDFSDTDDGLQCERNMKELPEEDVLSESPDSLERDVAQNTALRLHSCCEKKEIRCSTLDRESDGNTCAAGVPLQLCDSVRERERIVEDSANQTQITVEFLDERNNLIEMNENQLSVKPVEFQGHQIKGSAASEIMLRNPCSQLGWQQYPDNMQFAAERFLSPPVSSNYVLSDFSQICPVSESKSRMAVIGLRTVILHDFCPLHIFPSTGTEFSSMFPISAPGPEDRNYETSVFGEYMEDRQRESVQPVFPNVTSHCRQSKWLKYQSSAQCDLITQNSDDVEVMDGICPESILGMLLGDTGESQSSAVNENAPGPAPLQTAKSMLGKCGAKSSSQDSISERKLLSLHLSQAPLGEPTQKVLSHLSCHTVTGDVQEITVSELSFPNVDKVKYANLPKRKIAIPIVFQSHVHYKQIFKAALTEHLNIMLFELSQRLHNALSKVDVSFYTSLKDGQSESKESGVLLCSHMRPAKLVTVKKEGQNKGRLFYACDAPRAERCSFFKWIEEVNPAQIKSRPSVVLHDIKSIGTYLRSQKISVFEGCQLLVRKAYEIQTQRCSKLKKFMNVHAKFDGDSKNKLYLKLSRKEHYSIYSKDDIWVVSKTLNFDPLDTFIACSAFFGPSSNNEVELLPLKGYYPSNWQSNISVHALLVCNASGELTSLRNMEEYFNPSTLPLIPYLLKIAAWGYSQDCLWFTVSNKVNKRKFTPPAMSLERTMMHGPVSTEVAMGLAEKMIETFSLNPDQAASLVQIAQMMTSLQFSLVTLAFSSKMPGVFGAGKSYLLSVVILFLVQLFESSEAEEGPRAVPWKLLIASSTNVAVDRILLGLLDLGFEDFIRVGSIRKITKAILPHSLHAGSGNENEQLKELLALLKEDLTPVEKIYVRKSIEQHKLGTNKTILQQVKVVGATCAACPFPCLNNLKFPVVMLDECSQMTEPASLLPIARFQCEKLVLVGDPKQLPPTIQGSESVHEKGLEQTLFDRLCLMGHKTIPLRTQYRCHPAISAIANELFYEGNLIDGVSEKERSPLLDWLPTLCFYSANGTEQTERDNSFYNMAEAHFTVKLIQSLIASGIEGSVIGVITLYKSQMCKIQNLLNSVHSEAFEIKAVQVSTVDAFQGAEKEIIVLSCVRTRQMGFIDSEKRMNVALTRAKRHLLIVGNLACLSKNRLWGRVIHHCKSTFFLYFQKYVAHLFKW